MIRQAMIPVVGMRIPRVPCGAMSMMIIPILLRGPFSHLLESLFRIFLLFLYRFEPFFQIGLFARFFVLGFALLVQASLHIG